MTEELIGPEQYRRQLNAIRRRVFAPRPAANALDERGLLGKDMAERRITAAEFAAHWRGLHEKWGALNGLHRSNSHASLPMLAQNRGFNWRSGYATPSFPWRDHPTTYIRDRRVAAIVSEPYPSEVEEAALREVAGRLGLRIHMPANRFASFWNPGARGTAFVVLVRADFGTVLWLDDQLNFAG